MRDLFAKCHEILQAQEDAVLVTVVANSGSVPRGSGARMLVTKDGRVAGTIGGGAVEYRSMEAAKIALAKKSSTSEHFHLYPSEVADIGMICGGEVEVFFRYIPSNDAMRDLMGRISELFQKKIPFWLITQLDDQTDAALAVYTAEHVLYGDEIEEDILRACGEKPVQTEANGKRYYIEKLVNAGYVYIFGGGHVAQQLVPVLSRCDFDCIVVEDREDFADPALFEHKAQTICLPMEKLDAFAERITKEDYICIMTRGHQNDYLVQSQMLKTPARYIGVIGSRKKIAAVRDRLRSDGFTDADMERITAPIGIDIASETPAEIAVSIAAQLIRERNTKEGSPVG